MASTWPIVATTLLITLISASAYTEIYLAEETRAKLDENHLPRHITPSSYVLKLIPQMDDGYFNGSVQITIVCNDSTDTIVLHAHKELSIINHKIEVSDKEAMSITQIIRDESKDILTITTEEKLQQGQTYKLYFEFSGILKTVDRDNWQDQNDGGFFLGNYENTENEKSLYAITTTYPNYARRIFPCFDEPAFKSTFEISVARPTDMSTLSMMPVGSIEQHEDETLTWDHFPPSPLLPTFSVNILVSDLVSLDPEYRETSEDEIKMKVFSRENSYTENLKDNTKSIPDKLNYLQEYLKVPHPTGKVDIVALPEFYMTYTQMYTPGLIIMPEYWINDIYPEMNYTLVNQWISGLITPQDWSTFNITYIINSFLMDKMASHVSDSNQGIERQYQNLYYTYSTSFNRTGYEEYSPYTTSRGQVLLNMLSYVLGNDTIAKAFENFIIKRKYGTFTERQLWKEMTLEAWNMKTLPTSLTVEEIVDTWLHNQLYRYPVLTVMRNYLEGTANVEQHTFSSEQPHNLTVEEKAHLWTVPITYITNNNMDINVVNQVTWIKDRQLDINNLPDGNSFIIINPTDAGMFLVNYGSHNWELITKALLDSNPEIPTVTRMKLLNDALLLAMGGELDYVTALNVTLFLHNEKEYKIWDSFINNFENLQTLYRFSSVEDSFNSYMKKLLNQIMDESKGAPDYSSDPGYATFWYSMKRIYDELGNQKRIDRARKRLEDFMPTFTFNDSVTGLVMFCPEFMKNPSDDWSDKIGQLQDYMNECYDIKQLLERSFAKCPGYSDIIQRQLDGLLDENMIYQSGRWDQMINMVTSSKEAHEITFSYFMDNYHELKKKFYFMKDMWSSLVTGVTTAVRTETGLNKLILLYANNKENLGYTETILESSIKEVRKAVTWQKKSILDIKYWFKHILPDFETL